jgi:hypothetical protein
MKLSILMCTIPERVVDDDDVVKKDYKDKLLEAIKSGVDVVNFYVGYSENGGKETMVRYSSKFVRDKNTASYFERIPNHIMCIKKSLALKVMFKDMGYGEDADFAQRLKPLLKREMTISKVLYQYKFNSDGSKSRYNTSRR